MNNRDKIKSLTESAILIALATVLSLLKLFEMPLGGSVTLASMLPICVISIRRGLKRGFIASFIYALIQLLLGIVTSGLLAWCQGFSLFGCIMLDYILAYTSIGIAGIFRKKGTKGIVVGVSLAFLIRLFFHVLSGCIIFVNLEQWSFFGTTFINRPILYSICYNALYIVPELLISYILVFILMGIPVVKKELVK